MNAKELRLGNLVTIDNPKHHSGLKGLFMKVTGIMEYNPDDCSISVQPILNAEYSYSQLSKFIKPIQLNRGWLVDSFGFIDDTITISLGLIMLADNRENGSFTCWYKHFGEYNRIEIDVKYVHELQNLYFSLTKEELKLKTI